MGRIDLHDLLLGLQEELAVGLGNARRLIGHPGAKGTASEEEWAAALDGFLPGRYEVATQVKVIDADGAESDLIDLVIHDRHHTPLLFEKGGMCYIPAESVYAIFEVKQELTRDDVLYAIKKARSVRSLRRTSADFVDAGGRRRARPLFHIVAGILATASSWTPPFGDPLREALAEADEESRLELACALKHGAFEATYEHGTGSRARPRARVPGAAADATPSRSSLVSAPGSSPAIQTTGGSHGHPSSGPELDHNCSMSSRTCSPLYMRTRCRCTRSPIDSA